MTGRSAVNKPHAVHRPPSVDDFGNNVINREIRLTYYLPALPSPLSPDLFSRAYGNCFVMYSFRGCVCVPDPPPENIGNGVNDYR